ncbi:MAG TPA: class IV adenylate cyclase [Bryobacteraceae bacterium]|nr:class IV adenylate cyclase [Bryobacteraceae bacterium]
MARAGTNREVEIKLSVTGAAVGRRLLRQAGFRVSRRRVFEDNLIFDTPRLTLRRGGRLLRLRQVNEAGTLTFKGPAIPGKHKDREELELDGVDPHTAQAILSRLGFRPAFRYQKYRTEFRAPGGPGVATLDETPIGVFLELEGSPQWIDRTARKLGFTEADYITASYGRLYFEWCRREHVRPAHMVFPGR